MSLRCHRAAVFVVGLMTSSCAETPPDTSSNSYATVTTVPSVTFARDIAPIVYEQCTPCHRPGGSGPFSLVSYADVSRRARQVAEVTASRFMPPWLPEPGFGEFVGERWLTEEQIARIASWAESGAPSGNPDEFPNLPVFTEGWGLGEPDLVVSLPRPYILPGEGVDIFRNLVMPIPVSERRWVQAVELRPGNPQFIHHAIMAVDDTASSRRLESAETEQPGQPGFSGMEMGQAFMPDGHLMGWTPGMAPNPGADDLAWRLDPGTDFVLQLHMVPSGRPETVEPIAGFYFADEPPSGPPLYLIRLDADHLLDIPPGEANFVVTDTISLPVDVEVHAVYPHAHYLATSMEGKAMLPDGTERWLLRIDEWDFNWQDVYRVAEPYILPRGTTVSMRFAYDNSAENPRNPSTPPARVRAGNRSSDEMAHLQLQVRPESTGDLVVLEESLYRHALRNRPDNPWNYYGLGNALWESNDLASATAQYEAGLVVDPTHAPMRNNLGAVLEAQGRTSEAVAQFREAVRLDPEFADAHYNLGNGLLALRRHDEANEQYREALRLEPDHTGAHANLGYTLQQQGALDDAIIQYREALRLQPGSAEAHNNLGSALAMSGRIDEAIGLFQRTLTIEPTHAQARDNLTLALEVAEEMRREGIR